MTGLQEHAVTRIAGVILAGGLGSRLGGVTKAALRIGGEPMLARVAAVLGAGAAPVLVARGPLGADAPPMGPDVTSFADAGPNAAGPVGGIAAAVEWCGSHAPDAEFLVSASVDTPFLPPTFVATLRAALTPESGVAVAGFDSNGYFTNALWRLEALRSLPRRVRDGSAPRSLKGLIAELKSVAVDFPADVGGDPFVNVNTVAELIAAQRRARSQGL